MGMDEETPIFATSCTPYTFLHFVNLQTRSTSAVGNRISVTWNSGRLRLVCRSWNEFVLFTSHRWLQLDEGDPMYELDSTILGAGGVGPVERLSTTINSEELVTPILSWVSHILKCPANQSPLRPYTLRLFRTPGLGYNPLDDLVGRTVPECNTNTNEHKHKHDSALPQHHDIIRLKRIHRAPANIVHIQGTTRTLPSQRKRDAVADDVAASAGGALRALHTPVMGHAAARAPGPFQHRRAQFVGVLDGFLGRYAGQLESLALLELSKSPMSLM